MPKKQERKKKPEEKAKKEEKIEKKEVKSEKVSKKEITKEETKPKEKAEKTEEKKEEKPKEEVKKPEEAPAEVKVEIEEEVIEKLKEEEKAKEVVEKVVEKEKEELSKWIPKTSLGKDVAKRKITDINKILDEGIRIKESGIVDFLVSNLESELIFIGGRPGKGGGIERTPLRISAKMHKSGRRYTSTAFVVVGNKDGLIGVGKGRAKESRRAIDKAIKKAKLNLIKIPRGCGSWECGCREPHSIPFKAEGKAGSVRITLLPAPRGIGLAVDDETKKILSLAGIHDVWGKTLGNTGSRINLISAVFDALRNLHKYRTSK
jgi:small subunit ribosomal protein S5